MAQLLSKRHSTTTCLSVCMRHIRLLRQVKGTEELVAAIDPFRMALLARKKETEIQAENKTVGYDLLVLNDALLDDKVRNLSEGCKQYDRGNPGRPVHDLIFPKGNITSIIRVKMEEEPEEINTLIKRVESLGTDHPIAMHIAFLQSAVDNSKKVIADYKAAIDTLKLAEALEEIAKTNLIRQYELNYYDALKKFGKIYANRLFPTITQRSTNDGDESGTTDSPDTKA
jgi:hypothetical protein